MQTFYQFIFLFLGIFSTFICVINIIQKSRKTALTSDYFDTVLSYCLLSILICSIFWMIFFYCVKNNNTLQSNEIVFVWNDDEESIPMDGSLITLEFTDENTVYIGPYNKTAKAE